MTLNMRVWHGNDLSKPCKTPESRLGWKGSEGMTPNCQNTQHCRVRYGWGLNTGGKGDLEWADEQAALKVPRSSMSLSGNCSTESVESEEPWASPNWLKFRLVGSLVETFMVSCDHFPYAVWRVKVGCSASVENPVGLHKSPFPLNGFHVCGLLPVALPTMPAIPVLPVPDTLYTLYTASSAK